MMPRRTCTFTFAPAEMTLMSSGEQGMRTHEGPIGTTKPSVAVGVVWESSV